MIRQAPEIQDLHDDVDAVRFAVCVTVDVGDMPGVSVKAAPGTSGSAAVLSATVLSSPPGPGAGDGAGDGTRAMRFDVEADKSAVAWQVAVVVSCGPVTVPLTGPLVPALTAARLA